MASPVPIKPPQVLSAESQPNNSRPLGLIETPAHSRGDRFRARLLDPNFGTQKWRYLAQCGLATSVILVVLLALDVITQTVLIASFGASTFTAFAMPRVNASNPRYLIGGYSIGTIVGCCGSLLSQLVHTPLPAHTELIVCAALAVGLAMFLMVVTDTEHPPAAALALGYVFNPWNLTTVVAIIVGICAIAMIKQILRPHLKDLL